jgi:hypothetical protein
MSKSKRRRLPTTEQAVEAVKQGMMDDLILHLSDDELREALVGYRRADPETDESKSGSAPNPRPRRSIA